MSKIELTDHPYLYLSSLAEAKRNNELDRWRESHQHNMACKAAIEAAIRKDFDGTYLNADCAHGVIVEYGFKRVGWVLTNTIQRKNHDGRFSIKNKEWAESNYILRTATAIPRVLWKAIPLYWTGSLTSSAEPWKNFSCLTVLTVSPCWGGNWKTRFWF